MLKSLKDEPSHLAIESNSTKSQFTVVQRFSISQENTDLGHFNMRQNMPDI